MKKLFEYNVRRLKYKNHEIQTYSFGTGEKKILSLPSFPHSGIYYILFTQFYDPTKFQVITLDVPGWAGWSDNIFNGDGFNPTEYTNLLKLIIKEYELDKFSLIGYSFGGALAINLASLYPEKIKSLAIVSTIVNGELLNGTKEKSMLRLAKVLHQEKRLKKYILKEFTRYNDVVRKNYNDALFEQYRGMMNQADPRVLFESLYWLFNSDFSNQLERIKAIKNILIVNSRNENPMFRRQIEFIRRTLDKEDTMKISGQHEDFILQPKSENIKAVLKFLLQ